MTWSPDDDEKIIKYEVVQEDNARAFNQAAKRLVDDGYTPVGKLKVNGESISLKLIQAFAKYGSRE